jgi:indoleamine 2,3-dioxygenase
MSITSADPMILLQAFDVDPISGFLPNPDPLTSLPSQYAVWDWIGRNLPALLLSGQLRSRIERMPLLDPADLEGQHQRERAMMLLSTMVNAYVWAGPEPQHMIPPSLAIPLCHVSELVGRKPILSHASNVLYNWQRIDPHGPIDLENVSLLQPLLNSSDEAWFVLVTVVIEAKGAVVLPELVRAQHAAATQQYPELIEALDAIATGIERMSATLMRMYEHCDPYIFYHRVRPFLAGWPAPGVIYQGVSEQPVIYAGGSAGQSSLIQALDAALGVRHTSEQSRPFLAEMRHYMPPTHRRFVEALEQGPQLHQLVAEQATAIPPLLESYNRCIERLTLFRRQHMEIAVRYITMQAPGPDKAVGTGGTSFTHFLGAAKHATRAHIITRDPQAES